MKNILFLAILITNMRGTPYGLTYDIYENYYDYEMSDNDIDSDIITPQFISQPLNMIVNSGKTAKLPCIVDRLEGFVLLWKKNDHIISVGQQLLDKSNIKYRIEPVNNGNYLMISSIEAADEDKYTCAVSTINKEEISHILRVRIKPEIETSPAEMVTLREGDSLSLTCNQLAGSPAPSLRWSKCDGGLLSEGGVYTAQAVSRAQAGCYRCEADNGYTVSPVTAQVTVIVQYAPQVTMGKTVDSVESMSLLCNVQAQPQANVVIYKEDKQGGRQVFYSDNHNNSMVGIIHDPSHDITMYELELEELDASKFGNYYCVADNMLGEDSDTVKISGWPSVTSVKISPDPAQSLCYRVTVSLQSDSPVLSVRFSYSHNMGTVNVVPSGEVTSHRLCNLSYSSHYWVYVSAANSYGYSPEIQYNFTTDHQPLINLSWSSGSSFHPSYPVCQIMLILQLGLLMIPRL